MPDEIARFSAHDARAFEPFMETLRPIYEQGILGAGRRAFQTPGELARFVPSMVRLGAALPLSRMVARHFEHPRIREAMSFHSLFIGGDPHRVPAIYGALVYLQFLDGVWYADGGVYSVIEAMARALDVRCGDPVERIETAGGRVTGVRTRGGERVPADIVVSNTDALQVHELLGNRPPVRRLRPTMSCFLLYLGLNRRFEQLRHHHLLVGSDYKGFVRDVTRRGRLPKTCSVYIHAPDAHGGRHGPARRRLAVRPAAGPPPRRRAGRPARAGCSTTWRGPTGSRACASRSSSSARCPRRTSATGSARGRATPSAPSRPCTSPPTSASTTATTASPASTTSAPGRIRAPGIPGVVLGAEVTAGLVLADHQRVHAAV